MIHTMMPGTEELLEKEQVTAYLGIDPTADSLHIGHLCGVMMLKHFQRCGHKPLALIGGATGMIGDPSGKSQERNLLDEETLRHNVACIKQQLARFLDFDSDAPNHAELVNNYDWMKDFTFLDFVREVGKHITVNYMMAKDSVKRRLNGEARDGLSFTEFTYQLLQGYDFLHLYETKGCKLQMGGSDQWGNITTGAELIRRTNGGEVFALTCPLITKADGGKFGKTESGNIWLDPRYTSPYKFYQFWLNVSDSDAERYIKIFTSIEKEEIEALIACTSRKPRKASPSCMISCAISSASAYRSSRSAFFLAAYSSFVSCGGALGGSGAAGVVNRSSKFAIIIAPYFFCSASSAEAACAGWAAVSFSPAPAHSAGWGWCRPPVHAGSPAAPPGQKGGPP